MIFTSSTVDTTGTITTTVNGGDDTQIAEAGGDGILIPCW